MTTEIVSLEFLEANGFRLKQFPDGNFWIRNYHFWYFLQANEDITKFFEYEGDSCVIPLTPQEFIDTINIHDKAINQQ